MRTAQFQNRKRINTAVARLYFMKIMPFMEVSPSGDALQMQKSPFINNVPPKKHCDSSYDQFNAQSSTIAMREIQFFIDAGTERVRLNVSFQ